MQTDASHVPLSRSTLRPHELFAMSTCEELMLHQHNIVCDAKVLLSLEQNTTSVDRLMREFTFLKAFFTEDVVRAANDLMLLESGGPNMQTCEELLGSVSTFMYMLFTSDVVLAANDLLLFKADSSPTHKRSRYVPAMVRARTRATELEAATALFSLAGKRPRSQ
jgi:hypothetical protein